MFPTTSAFRNSCLKLAPLLTSHQNATLDIEKDETFHHTLPSSYMRPGTSEQG